MKKLNMWAKLSVGLGVPVGLFIIAITAAALSFRTVRHAVTDLYYGNTIAVEHIEELKSTFSQMTSALYEAMIYDNATDRNAALRELETLAAEAETQGLALMEQMSAYGMNMAAVEAAFAESRTINELRAQVVDMINTNRVDEAVAFLNSTYAPAGRSMDQKLSVLVDDLIAAAESQIQYTLNSYWWAMGVLWVGMIAATLSAVVLGISIQRNVVNPIKAVMKATNDMKEGELTVQIKTDGEDEICRVADAVQVVANTLEGYIDDIVRGLSELEKGNLRAKSNMEYKGDFKRLQTCIYHLIDFLNDTIRAIGHAAEQVAGSSSQVADGAQALSQGATEQASSVQELAATIQELSRQVDENAGHAREASLQANTAGTELEESNKRMNSMITAMQEISKSSNEISKIIKTIEDIAFQTNILALNAAVEAARAGAAGKGFAVVADEVRNLASKSAEASKNTAELIERSVRAVENGTHIAHQTADSLDQAISYSKTATELMDRISAASTTQSQSLAQVTVGVDQISGVVQTNSATAEESAAASEELSSQAHMLRELVSRFQLLDEGSHNVAKEEAAILKSLDTGHDSRQTFNRSGGYALTEAGRAGGAASAGSSKSLSIPPAGMDY